MTGDATRVAALAPGRVAVVTGGASGIGLAAARAFAARGLRIAVVDRDGERSRDAVASLSVSGAEAAAFVADMSDRGSTTAAVEAIVARFGALDVLMANAAIQPGSRIDGPGEAWDRILATNLGGVVNVVQAALPAMLAGAPEAPGLVVVTGSKQGITTPPGDPAYNVAKAGVKAFAEALAHDLRNRSGRRLSAHLLIPGFVWTPLTQGERTEKPAAAWTPDETVAFMLASLGRDEFYILCPDNDVSRALDERRILWAAGDIVDNRPALSRWHPAWRDRFARFVARTGSDPA